GDVTTGVIGFVEADDRGWTSEELNALKAIASLFAHVTARVLAAGQQPLPRGRRPRLDIRGTQRAQGNRFTVRPGTSSCARRGAAALPCRPRRPDRPAQPPCAAGTPRREA